MAQTNGLSSNKTPRGLEECLMQFIEWGLTLLLESSVQILARRGEMFELNYLICKFVSFQIIGWVVQTQLYHENSLNWN